MLDPQVGPEIPWVSVSVIPESIAWETALPSLPYMTTISSLLCAGVMEPEAIDVLAIALWLPVF